MNPRRVLEIWIKRWGALDEKFILDFIEHDQIKEICKYSEEQIIESVNRFKFLVIVSQYLHSTYGPENKEAVFPNWNDESEVDTYYKKLYGDINPRYPGYRGYAG